MFYRKFRKRAIFSFRSRGWITRKRKNAELGYWLSEPYWNKGIVSKVIMKIVTKAFQKFDIIRIFAAPFGTNTASHHVLKKVGFKLEPVLKERFIKMVNFLMN